MEWTTGQESFLREYGYMGAQWCTEQLAEEFGVERSLGSVQRHGSRIGVSFERIEHCPVCGKAVRRIDPRIGMCRDCNARRKRDESKRRAEEAEAMARATRRAAMEVICRAEANQAEDGRGAMARRLDREGDMYRKRAQRARENVRILANECPSAGQRPARTEER